MLYHAPIQRYYFAHNLKSQKDKTKLTTFMMASNAHTQGNGLMDRRYCLAGTFAEIPDGLVLVIALRPQTLKQVRCGWSHYSDTSEPVDGDRAQNMVTVQSGFRTRDLSITDEIPEISGANGGTDLQRLKIEQS
jgi:hypothetical protein